MYGSVEPKLESSARIAASGSKASSSSLFDVLARSTTGFGGTKGWYVVFGPKEEKVGCGRACTVGRGALLGFGIS